MPSGGTHIQMSSYYRHIYINGYQNYCKTFIRRIGNVPEHLNVFMLFLVLDIFYFLIKHNKLFYGTTHILLTEQKYEIWNRCVKLIV